MENGRKDGVVYRLMITTIAHPEESTENKAVESIPKGEEKSGETNQAGSSGKPIGGGVPFFTFALICLLIFFYKWDGVVQLVSVGFFLIGTDLQLVDTTIMHPETIIG